MGRIVVEAEGFETDAGVARVAMFGPGMRHLAATAPISGGRARCVFDDLEPGRYAVSVYHDADGDGDLGDGEAVSGLEQAGVVLDGEEAHITLRLSTR